MKQIYFTLFILFILNNSYSQIGAEVISSTTGTLSGVPFTLSFNDPSGAGTYSSDLSGGGFSGAPLSNNQPVFVTAANTNFSVTFDSPIPNLRLYCVFWRNTTYDLDQEFTIISGTTHFQNPNDNILHTLEFSDGIIEFTDPVTTLNLAVIAGATPSQIAFTFGLGAPLSVNESEYKTNSFKIYPNPSSDFIEVDGLTKIERYTIYNTLGEEIINRSVSVNEKIDIRNLSDGNYFLKAYGANNTVEVKQFIKK